MHYLTLEMTFITLSMRSDKLKMTKFAFWLPPLGVFFLFGPSQNSWGKSSYIFEI